MSSPRLPRLKVHFKQRDIWYVPLDAPFNSCFCLCLHPPPPPPPYTLLWLYTTKTSGRCGIICPFVKKVLTVGGQDLLKGLRAKHVGYISGTHGLPKHDQSPECSKDRLRKTHERTTALSLPKPATAMSRASAVVYAVVSVGQRTPRHILVHCCTACSVLCRCLRSALLTLL